MRATTAATQLWCSREVRRRWKALVALGLLAGAAAGTTAAAIAGARRTDTAYERLRHDTKAADAIVFASQVEIYAPDWSPFDALPYVTAAGSFGLTTTQVAGHPELGVFEVASGHWLTEVDKPLIVEGRAPDMTNPHEVMASVDARGAGVRVGSTYTVETLSAEQLAREEYPAPGEEWGGPRVSVTVVGVGKFLFNMALIPAGGDLYATPAFHEAHGRESTFVDNLLVRLEHGEADIPRLERDAKQILGVPELPVLDATLASKRVTNGTALERDGLLLFAAGLAVAGGALVGQATARSVRAPSEDASVLRALGLTRREGARALVLAHVVAIAVAAVTTVGVAIALSPRFPIGLGRQVEPDPGVHADWAVVGLSTGLMVAFLTTVAGLSARREVRALGRVAEPRRSLIVAAAATAGAPVVPTIGAQLALEPGRGRRALPTRPALAGAIVGVTGVVGALTLSAGLNDAGSNPARFGQVWDVAVHAFSAGPSSAALGLADDPDVAAAASVRRGQAIFDGTTTPAYVITAVQGSMGFVLTDGRAPRRAGEVALGPATARRNGVAIGDQVRGSSDGTVVLTVVGIAFLPQTPHSSYDEGAWVHKDDLGLLGGPPERATLGRFREGVDAGAAIERLAADRSDEAVEVVPPEAPQDLVNLRNVRSLPVLFAALTALLSLGTLAHVTASVVRRRAGELAVLRALGLTPRQTRACLSWQATTLAAIGVVAGVPVGLAIGQSVWRWVADATPMVYVAPIAVAVLLAAAPFAVVLANGLAFWPGRRAARLRPAEVLRTE